MGEFMIYNLQHNSSKGRFFVLILFCALFVANAASADHVELPKGTSAAPKIQLKSLIDEAIEKNAELRAAKYAVESKEAQVSPKGAYEDPMIAFEAMNYPVDTLSQREFGMTGNQISLTQKIPFPGKLTKLKRSASSEAEAEKAILEKKRLEIIKNIKLTYYELFAAYKKYDTLNEQKGLVGQILVVTRNHYSLGKTPQAEVLNLQVEEASLIDQLLSSERQIKSKLGELNHLLGRVDHGEYLNGRPEDPAKTPFDFVKNTEKAVADKVLGKSPMVKAQRSMLEAAEAKLSYTKWNYFPDFEFKFGYTFRKPSPGDRGVDFVSGMVGITIPIWAGAKQSEEKRGAEAQKIRAEALLDEERISLAHMVHQLYAELEESHKRVQLYEGGVLPLTRQAVVSAKSAYLTSKLEYATLLNLMNKRFQVEVGYAEALATYESKLAELESLLGEPLGG